MWKQWWRIFLKRLKRQGEKNDRIKVPWDIVEARLLLAA
jgi:hypothetical protein